MYPTRNLFSLLGNTIGNYDESLLIKIYSRRHECRRFTTYDARILTSDIKISPTISEEEKLSVLNAYRHPANDQFAFGPVEMVTTGKS